MLSKNRAYWTYMDSVPSPDSFHWCRRRYLEVLRICRDPRTGPGSTGCWSVSEPVWSSGHLCPAPLSGCWARHQSCLEKISIKEIFLFAPTFLKTNKTGTFGSIKNLWFSARIEPTVSGLVEEIWSKLKKWTNCKKSGPLRERLSTEKKLLTVIVGLFSLREKAPTQNRHKGLYLTISFKISPNKSFPLFCCFHVTSLK